jgi:two-component system, response regulator PdtaR
MGPTPKVVVVAEDEAAIRFNAAEMLCEAGFDVLEAKHADEALSHLGFRHDDICVLFTDIEMPGEVDGLALAHHTRMHWPLIGLLVTSGRGRPHAPEMPVKCRFIAKPYVLHHVINHVRELVAEIR